MRRTGNASIYFRAPIGIADQFDRINMAHGLTRQSVLVAYMMGYTEDQAASLLLSNNELERLADELQVHELNAAQVKQKIAMLEERKAKLQDAKKPKASPPRRGGMAGRKVGRATAGAKEGAGQ